MKSLTVAMILLSSSMSFAQLSMEQLKCSFDLNGSSKQEIRITPGYPGSIQVTDIEGFKVGASFVEGDSFESQQLLSMSMNGIVSSVYAPKESLYVLTDETGMARFQCFLDR